MSNPTPRPLTHGPKHDPMTQFAVADGELLDGGKALAREL